MSNSKSPSYEELKRRLEVAESTLQAIREGGGDTILGKRESLVVRLAEVEAREAHLKQVLLAIRNVNQLIVAEDDPQRLIQKTCENLTATLGYFNAWIAILDETDRPMGKIGLTAFNGGISADEETSAGFAVMREQLSRGSFPTCMRRALHDRPFVVVDDPPSDCPDCPLAPLYAGRAGLVHCLAYEGRTFGTLSVSVPAPYAHDAEEQAFFAEVARDLAFALFKIEAKAEKESVMVALSRSHMMMARTEAIAHVGSWEWDVARDHVHWSDELFRIFGRTPDTGAPSFAQHPELYLPEDIQRLREAVERCVSHGTPYELELRAIRSDGELRHCVARGQAEIDKTGRVVKLAGSLQDLTEEKKLVREIENQRQHLESLMKAIPAPVFFKDKHGRYLGCNPAFEALAGSTREQITGKTTHEVWAEKHSTIYRDKDLQLLATGGTQQYASKLVNAQGEERDVIFHNSAFKDQSGEIEGLVGVVLDITERKRAEECLLESEEKFRSFVENANDIVYSLNPTGVFTYVSPNWLNAMGESADEAVGKSFEPYVHPEDVCVCREFLERILSTGKKQTSAEYRVRHSNGSWRWHLSNGSPLRDKTGNIIGYVGIGRDITDRKRAEEALKASETWLSETTRVARVGGWKIDLLGNTLEWTDETFRIHELPSGNPPTVTEAIMFYHAEDRPRASAAVQHALEKNESFDFEARLITAKQNLIWVRSIGHVSFHKDSMGLVWGTIQDITELKKAEQDLSSTLSLLDATLESIEDGILVIDNTGKITKMNQKFLELWQIPAELAISSEENNLLQYAIKQLAEPEAFLTRVRELYDDPADTSFDEIGFLDGRVFERFSQPQWLGKQIVGRVWSFRDVTFQKKSELEQEKLQAQLRQAQKMESVGRLAGGVAHDFNNMLGIILGHIEMALEETAPASPLHAGLQAAQRAAERSADLTRQLLAFARKQTVAPKVIDLNETVAGMLKMLHRLIGEDIDLLWKPGKNLAPVKMDPSQIDQILANLCVNARDAIVDVGKITIETGVVSFDEAYCAVHAGFVPGEYVLLAISDNGCGMDQEIISHLFEPFFTTKEQGKGTGLGLASVYGAVKQNNGFINVYSEPGQGSTFKIYLPQHQASTPRHADTTTAKPIAKGTETILLVEDEPAILDMATMMLKRLGYVVIAAKTPGEAIRLAHEHNGDIDLLLTDVVMPEMNGRDLAKHLLSIYPSIKRLFMSGYTANVIAHHGVLAEGVCFIQKPFSLKALAEKVRGALEG